MLASPASESKEVWGHFPAWVYREIHPGPSAVAHPSSIKGYQLVGILWQKVCLKRLPARLPGVPGGGGTAVATIPMGPLGAAVAKQKGAWAHKVFCYLVQAPPATALEDLLHCGSTVQCRVVCYSLREDGSVLAKALSASLSPDEFRQVADRLLRAGIGNTPGGGLAASDEVVCSEMYGSKMELSLPCTLVSYRLEQGPSCALVWECSELVPGDRVRVGGYISPTEDFERTVGGKTVNRGMRTFTDVVLRMHRHVTSSYEKKSCIAVHDGAGFVLRCFQERALLHGGPRDFSRLEKSYGWKLPVGSLEAALLPSEARAFSAPLSPRLQVTASGAEEPIEREAEGPRQWEGLHKSKEEEEEEEGRDLGRCITRTLGERSDQYSRKRKALLKQVYCTEAPKRPCPWGPGDAGQFSYRKKLVAMPRQGVGRDSVVVRQVWDPAQVLAIGSGSWVGGGDDPEWVCCSRDPAWVRKHAVGALDPVVQWACYTKRSPPNFDPRATVSHASEKTPFSL